MINMEKLLGWKRYDEAEKLMEVRRVARASMQFMLEEAFQVKVLPSGLAFISAAIMGMAEGMTEEEIVEGVRDAFKWGETIVPQDARDRARKVWKGARDVYAKGEE